MSTYAIYDLRTLPVLHGQCAEVVYSVLVLCGRLRNFCYACKIGMTWVAGAGAELGVAKSRGGGRPRRSVGEEVFWGSGQYLQQGFVASPLLTKTRAHCLHHPFRDANDFAGAFLNRWLSSH